MAPFDLNTSWQLLFPVGHPAHETMCLQMSMSVPHPSLMLQAKEQVVAASAAYMCCVWAAQSTLERINCPHIGSVCVQRNGSSRCF